MKKLTVREARMSISRLDQILQQEGVLTITRRGEPIAVVTPSTKKRDVPSHRDLRKKTARMRKGSEHIIRDDRNQK